MTRLVVDTSVLVGELLRVSGRNRLTDNRLDLFLPEHMWDEVQHVLPRRVAAAARHHGRPSDAVERLTQLYLGVIYANVQVLDEPIYAPLEEEAKARVPRDPDDWPLVACAMALTCAIWTHDKDLLGAGVPTWTSRTLQAWLDRT